MNTTEDKFLEEFAELYKTNQRFQASLIIGLIKAIMTKKNDRKIRYDERILAFSRILKNYSTKAYEFFKTRDSEKQALFLYRGGEWGSAKYNKTYINRKRLT
jgi:hypothetical protein